MHVIVSIKKGKFHRITCHEDTEESKGMAPFCIETGHYIWWVVNATPRPLLPPGITRCPLTRRWVGPRAGPNNHYKAFISIYFMGQIMELFHNKIFKVYLICVVFCLDIGVL